MILNPLSRLESNFTGTFGLHLRAPHVKESLLDGLLETIPANQCNQSLFLHVAHRHCMHTNEHHLHILLLCFLYHLFKDAS